MGGQFSILALWNLCSESVEAWNFEILVRNSDTSGPSSITVRIESSFTIFFLIPICNLCLKNDEGSQKALSNEGDEGKVAYIEKNFKKIKFHH